MLRVGLQQLFCVDGVMVSRFANVADCSHLTHSATRDIPRRLTQHNTKVEDGGNGQKQELERSHWIGYCKSRNECWNEGTGCQGMKMLKKMIKRTTEGGRTSERMEDESDRGYKWEKQTMSQCQEACVNCYD